MSTSDPTSTSISSSFAAATTSTTPATASHPSSSAPDPTTRPDATQGGHSTAAPTGTTELAHLKVGLRNGLRQFPDFPSPGILFEDIMPLFASPRLHADLIRALELQVTSVFGATTTSAAGAAAQGKPKIDIIVGLESRGFLFGPTLAMRLGAGFVPVRKQGKLPGTCVTEGYKKEYGEDFFQMQQDGIQPGQNVVVVDDIIATGGSASAAGSLVRQIGGNLLGYIFIMELDFLKGRAKLDAPVHTLLSGQEEALTS